MTAFQVIFVKIRRKSIYYALNLLFNHLEEQKEYIRKTQADKPVNSCGSVDERIRMSWLTYPHKNQAWFIGIYTAVLVTQTGCG